MGLVQILATLALFGFVGGCLYKAIHYAPMPLHLRWELYPVAHERGKAAYGGSYFEELDWWTKPREVSKLGEVKTIAEEVLTLKQVQRAQPRPLASVAALPLRALPSLRAWGRPCSSARSRACAASPGSGASAEGARWLSGARRVSPWPRSGAWACSRGASPTPSCVGPRRRRTSSTSWLLLAVFSRFVGESSGADPHLAVAATFVAGARDLARP